jgi:hypothetical protein
MSGPEIIAVLWAAAFVVSFRILFPEDPGLRKRQSPLAWAAALFVVASLLLLITVPLVLGR